MKALVLSLALIGQVGTSTAGYTPRELRLWWVASRATALVEVRHCRKGPCPRKDT